VLFEEVESAEAELAIELDYDTPPARAASESRETDILQEGSESAAASALSLLRELELSESRDLLRQRAELLARARAIAGAQTLVLCRSGESDMTVVDLAGALPPPTLVDRLAELLTESVHREPRYVVSTAGEVLLAVLRGPGPDDLALAALFPRRNEQRAKARWMADFFGQLRAKLAAVPADDTGVATSREAVDLIAPPEMILGQSPVMRALYERIRASVSSDLHVLISGETGTGKELFARLLHLSGPKSNGPFVAVNCAAIPAELLEAELFGVAANVATGVAPRDGLFLRAEGGSIFLDEIGELPAQLQAKLLRVLEEREVLKIGGSRPTPVDLHVIAATNRSLRELVASGAFRLDLYFRLAGLEFEVPSLRERRDDIPELILAFARQAAGRHGKSLRGVTRGAFERLQRYDWPGNVRELRTMIERAVLIASDGEVIGTRHFTDLQPGSIEVSEAETEPSGPAGSADPALCEDGATLAERLDAVRRAAIVEALDATGGNRTAAARRLGLSRNGLAMIIKRLGVGEH
jgi:DNA-binding NtrC family response regulator